MTKIVLFITRIGYQLGYKVTLDLITKQRNKLKEEEKKL
jgi:hypothetical protein